MQDMTCLSKYLPIAILFILAILWGWLHWWLPSVICLARAAPPTQIDAL